jgi:hypothetical protein
MKTRNNKVIESAFERFVTNKDTIIRNAMYGLLEDAVQIALRLHEEDGEHPKHLEIGDTYGWILMHNGRIEEAVVKSIDPNIGDTLDQLYEEAAFTYEKGWVGIVMAGMKPNYFSIRFETKILAETISITKDNFFEYFKKI